ncbi:hypothetical protein F-liban_91 [Faustovirus]|nr:hypothetical protein F-liban_91 [Faustovirus]SME64763.1 Hypothetical protein FSTVST1_88 [Faustovirus ST1]
MDNRNQAICDLLDDANKLSSQIKHMSDSIEYLECQINAVSTYALMMDNLDNNPNYRPNVYILIPLLTYLESIRV